MKHIELIEQMMKALDNSLYDDSFRDYSMQTGAIKAAEDYLNEIKEESKAVYTIDAAEAPDESTGFSLFGDLK